MRALHESESFYVLRLLAGFSSAADAAAWLDLTPRQVRRYERGETTPPRPVLLCLEYRAGELGGIDTAWHGWRLHQGALWAPGVRWSVGITPGDVLSLPYLLQIQQAVTASPEYSRA